MSTKYLGSTPNGNQFAVPAQVPIQTIRERRDRLANNIKLLIEEFQSETHVAVSRIDVTHLMTEAEDVPIRTVVNIPLAIE